MLWTVLADLLGLVLSYLYGMMIPAWIGRCLPRPLGLYEAQKEKNQFSVCVLPYVAGVLSSKKSKIEEVFSDQWC